MLCTVKDEIVSSMLLFIWKSKSYSIIVHENLNVCSLRDFEIHVYIQSHIYIYNVVYIIVNL